MGRGAAARPARYALYVPLHDLWQQYAQGVFAGDPRYARVQACPTERGRD